MDSKESQDKTKVEARVDVTEDVEMTEDDAPARTTEELKRPE